MQVFEVPDGFRMIVTQAPAGGLSRLLLPLRGDTPSWEWRYSMNVKGAVGLEFVRNATVDEVWKAPASQHAVTEEVLDYVI